MPKDRKSCHLRLKRQRKPLPPHAFSLKLSSDFSYEICEEHVRTMGWHIASGPIFVAHGLKFECPANHRRQIFHLREVKYGPIDTLITKSLE